MIRNLKSIRKMRGMTQQQLADVSDVPRVCISRYESGKYQPSFTNACKIAKALNVSVDALIKKKTGETQCPPLSS